MGEYYFHLDQLTVGYNGKPLIDQMKMYAYVLLIFFLRNKIMSEFYL